MNKTPSTAQDLTSDDRAAFEDLIFCYEFVLQDMIDQAKAYNNLSKQHKEQTKLNKRYRLQASRLTAVAHELQHRLEYLSGLV